MERIPLDAISPDTTFRLREPAGVPELASAIGRLGQLEPLDLRPLAGAGAAGPRFQLVAGFRRLDALRLLQRDAALARVHEGLSDQDAWALALAGPLFAEPWGPADLDALAPTLQARFPWAAPALAAARRRLAGGKVPPKAAGASKEQPSTAGPERTVRATAQGPAAAAPLPGPAADPAGFAHGLALRASALNEDLATAWDGWDAIPPAGRKMVLEQLHYLVRILPLLERESP